MNKSFFHFLFCSVVFAIVVLVLFPSQDVSQKSELPIIGQASKRSIVAPISFSVPKTQQELEEEKSNARDKIYPVFEYNEEATKRILDNFDRFIIQVEQYERLKREISASTAVEQRRIDAAGDLYRTLVKKISSTALNQLIQNHASRDSLKAIFHTMISQGVSNTLIAERNRDVTVFKESRGINSINYILHNRGNVMLIKDGKDIMVATSSIRIKDVLIDEVVLNNQSSSAFYEVLYVFVAPNIFYLDKETEARRTEAAAEVNPSKGMVPRGMEIVSQGSIITKETLEKLEAMQNAIQKEDAQFINTVAYGQYILLSMIIVALSSFLWFFRKKKNIHPRHLWAMAFIVIAQIVLYRLLHNVSLNIGQDELNPIWFYPFAFAPVLTSVLFSFKIAIAVALWSSTLLGIFASYDLSLVIVTFLISFSMCIIVDKIRYRVRFMQAWFAGLGIFAISLVGILLLRNSMSWNGYWQNFLLGAANLLICVTFISVFCNAFERLFLITTNLKLAELSDFNHPLLRHLSEYAPGSFHHSIQVGNLGEIAGERIGANTLLIRVMALYHDIGKTMRPEYFTENQRFGYNPHDNLSPYDSIKILRAHVERGVEFANEYNLPDPIIAGIREHHGSNAAFYFYTKAKEMYPDKEVKFSDFCYKNSIPQSKETAVLMLADTIEAISRSMQNANQQQLAKMIQKTIDDKMFDNQLNASGLTIKDLKELGEGFLQGLEGSTHSRIKYPTSILPKARSEKGNQYETH